MRILAALDLERDPAITFEAAVQFASRVNGELLLLYVAAPEPEFVGYGVGPTSVRDAVAHELRDEHRQLGALRELALGRGVSTRTAMVRGPTVETVLTFASQNEVNYVVVGSSGRSLMHELVVGSVTRGILAGATVPVLIVPAGA